jgi:amidase
MTTPSWQDTANKKREAILAAIPAEWRIEELPSVNEQIDVTEYIKRFLVKEELEITQSSADVIAKTVAEGTWTAEEVTRAFCFRAALAHQLVCIKLVQLVVMAD